MKYMGTKNTLDIPVASLFMFKKAVSYLRVSTRGQAERGGGAVEGYSIPAQREANKRKAASISAIVVKEFVDRGSSAKSADREELQNMLNYIKENDVDYVIIHKVDRLARNREDDVEIMRILRERHVKLVSTSEAIDETPSGMLLHGIMSSIAEFYSQNFANEVMKELNQKVKEGGIVSKAPLGYRNVRNIDERGLEERTVELDAERAPLIQRAFEMYATGDYTVERLAEYLAARGLTTKPTPRIPSKPIDKGMLNKALVNPYYKGLVCFNGGYHPGKHTPLVSEETWRKVQDILSSHVCGERERKHPHFLKSTVYCGACGSRLIIQYAKSKSGLRYPYFSCAGRHDKRNDCKQKSVLIETVEVLIEQLYDAISLKPEARTELEAWINTEIDKAAREFEAERRDLELEKDKLERKQKKLLETYYADAIPLDLFKAEQDEIKAALGAINSRIAIHADYYSGIKEKLNQSLGLLENCGTMYKNASDRIKRAFNQAIFEKIFVGSDGIVTAKYAEPYGLIFEPYAEENTEIQHINSPVCEDRAIRLIDFFPNTRNTDRKHALSHFFGRCFSKSILVALSGLDLNNYDVLVRYIKSFVADVDKDDISEEMPIAYKKVNEYGEIEVTKLTQQQKKLTDDEILQVIKDYQNGMNTYQLADKYGCYRVNISAQLKRQNIEVTTRKINFQNIAEIIRLYEGGMNTTQLAKQFDVACPTIIKYLHKNGVKMRTRWDH